MTNKIPFPLELKTKRLLICSPSVADAEQLREAIGETIDTLRPWMPWADHVPSPTEARENCLGAEKAFEEGRDYRLHLFLNDSLTFVGSSGLHRVDWSIPKFEIGYWVRQSHACQGYITEAVEEISRYALEDLGANRVEIRMSTKNTRSRRVAERLGFVLEGILRNDVRNMDGTLRDSCVFSKVKEDGRAADQAGAIA